MEDDPGLSRLLQKNLQRQGFTVEIASNGEEGLALLETSAYDLLLIDYSMPSCGGMEVIRRLSSKGAHPPAIMVTGQGNEEVAVEALKLGAADYIVKDSGMKYLELLPAVIDRVLSKQQLIRERQQMFEEVTESEERYRKLVELSPDGIALHIDKRFVFVNPAGARLLGASKPEELNGRSIFDVVHPDFKEVESDRLRRLEQGESSLPWIEEKLVRLDGRELEIEVSAVPFSFRGKQAVQVIFRDIKERKLAEKKLEYMALYDPLTDLPNRTLFFDRLNQAIALAKRNSYTFALMFLDLDGFKQVNDSMGHDIGDMLLKETARRLTDCLRKSDTVARMGGDEFTLVLTRLEMASDAKIVAEKVIACMSNPFRLKGYDCSVTVSIGISLYPSDSSDGEALFKHADTAMYRVKEGGKNGYRFFAPGEQQSS
jgi:diguanylate cyclase (GGDEF)-like protein/PAS domain S-box-containing protein